MGYVNNYNNHSKLNRMDDEREPLIKQYNGISFKIEIDFFEPGVVRYVAYPMLAEYNPGMRLVLDVEWIKGHRPPEDDVDELTLEFFHQQILDKLFEMADSVRQQKIQDWVGLDNPSASH